VLVLVKFAEIVLRNHLGTYLFRYSRRPMAKVGALAQPWMYQLAKFLESTQEHFCKRILHSSRAVADVDKGIVSTPYRKVKAIHLTWMVVKRTETQKIWKESFLWTHMPLVRT
jgi:hypothetical protein